MESIQKIFEGKVYGVEKIHLAIIPIVCLIIYLYFKHTFKNADNFTTTAKPKLSHIMDKNKTNKKQMTKINMINRLGKNAKILVAKTNDVLKNAESYFNI
jgi:hypothetical protein